MRRKLRTAKKQKQQQQQSEKVQPAHPRRGSNSGCPGEILLLNRLSLQLGWASPILFRVSLRLGTSRRGQWRI